MAFEPGHLAKHPLPSGIVGALSLGGYQLLADVAGVGAGRLGPQAFLLVAPDPDPTLPDAGTQIALHQPRLKDETEASAFTRLAAQLGYLRLSGYRLALDRHGLRSKVNLVNPGDWRGRGDDPGQDAGPAVRRRHERDEARRDGRARCRRPGRRRTRAIRS